MLRCEGIGYFGDERLKKNDALFARRLSERQEGVYPQGWRRSVGTDAAAANTRHSPAAVAVSYSSVRRIWRAHGLKPH
jgi:ribosomal protein L32E